VRFCAFWILNRLEITNIQEKKLKKILLFTVLFLAVFLFFEIGEYERYTRNIKIEESPIYTTAQIDHVTKTESRKSHHISYFLKYKFKTSAGEYRGSTNALDEIGLAKYLAAGAIDIVYDANDPSFNTVKTYFRPGRTMKEFKQSFFLSGFLGLIIAIPFGLLLSWKFGWLKRNNS
jgi:hypothetical protein